MRRLIPCLFVLMAACEPLAEPPRDFAPEPSDASFNTAGPDLPGGLLVIDGQTIEWRGERIRLANIDAPQMVPHASCWAEARLAMVARDELDRVRGEALRKERLTIQREGTDAAGQTLARVSFDGEQDAGEAMKRAGLAVASSDQRWRWCDAVSETPQGSILTDTRPSFDAPPTPDLPRRRASEPMAAP